MLKILLYTLPLTVGFVSGLLSAAGLGDWFLQLNKPLWMPPSWLFGPVWTLLYALMGHSLYKTWKSPPGSNKTKALLLFGLQLTCNFFWSLVFFRWHHLSGALFEILLTWLSIVLWIRSLYTLNKISAWIQIPYLLWVSFASVLTFALYQLNG